MRGTLFAAIAGLALPAGIGPLAAQQNAPAALAPSAKLPPHLPPRIEVNPRRLLYRHCEDRYVLQHRPSGTVLYPQRHCRWVRG